MENVNAKIITELRKTQKLFDKYYLNITNEEHLTKIEVLILGFLDNNPDYNTARNIEEVLGLKKSNISVAIDSLTNKGYIGKKSDSSDRRITRLRLMPASCEIILKIKHAQEKFFQKVFEGISMEEIEDYCNIVKKILENISRMSDNE